MRKDQIGPLQLIVFTFEAPIFDGQFANEIKKLNDGNVLRLVDGLAVTKDEFGKISTKQASQLNLEDATDYGAYIGSWIDLGSGHIPSNLTSEAMAATFHARYEYGLDEDDLKDIADNIPNGWTTIFALVEHLWAILLRDSVRQAGGVLLAQDFLSPEMLIAKGKQVRQAAAI